MKTESKDLEEKIKEELLEFLFENEEDFKGYDN